MRSSHHTWAQVWVPPPLCSHAPGFRWGHQSHGPWHTLSGGAKAKGDQNLVGTAISQQILFDQLFNRTFGETEGLTCEARRIKELEKIARTIKYTFASLPRVLAIHHCLTSDPKTRHLKHQACISPAVSGGRGPEQPAGWFCVTVPMLQLEEPLGRRLSFLTMQTQ